MKRTIWASVTVGLAALMTFGCGNVLSDGSTTNNGSNIPFSSSGGNAPAAQKIWALDTSGDLFSFSSDNPLSVTAKTTLTGTGGERMIAIDCRPRTGVLYGITVTGKVYWIEKNTGVCHFVGNGTNPAQINADIDFNPVVDRIRQEADAQNVRINPGTGAVAGVDTNLTINGQPANAVGCAYTNPEEAPNSTQLFVVTGATNRVYLQANPNDGILTEVGQLPVDIGSNVGFDFGPGNIGYIANQKLSDDFSTFLTFDPSSGAAAINTQIGGGKPVKSIAVDLSGPTQTHFVAIDSANNLVSFESTDPTTLTSSSVITGLEGQDVIIGCDFIPGGSITTGLNVVTRNTGTGLAKIYTVNLTPGALYGVATKKVDTLLVLTEAAGSATSYGVEIASPTLMAVSAANVPSTLEFNGEIQHQIPTVPPAAPAPVTATRMHFLNATTGGGVSSPGVVTYQAGDRLLANVPDTFIPAIAATNAFLGGDTHGLFGVDVSSQKVADPGAGINVSPFAEFTQLSGGNSVVSIGEMALLTTKTCEMDIEPNGSIWFCGNRLVVNTPTPPATVDTQADGFSTLYRVSPQTGGAITVSRIGGSSYKHFAIVPTLNGNLTTAP